MIIPVYVRDRLYLPRSPEFLDLLEELRYYFTYKNPQFGRMKAMGKYTGNIPMELTSWANRTVEDLGECLALPRGGTNKLREVFAKHNYTPRFVDQRLSLAPITGYHNSVVLRPDQERLAKAMIKYENCLIRSPTASGKTETALKVVEWMLEKSGPVLIIVWDSALLYQWVERTALRFGLRESEIGVIGDGKKQVKDITIGMQQTLRLHIGKYSHSFGSVIADEVQRFAAATFQYVIDRFPAKYRIGISASEQRRDGMEFLIYDAFGSVADEIKRSTLIDTGKIMDVSVRLIPTEFDYVVKMGSDYLSWNEIDAKHKDYNDLINVSSHDDDRNNLIWKFMEPVLKTGKISLVVSQRVAHAKYWESRIRAAGYSTGLMLGGTEHANEFESTLNGLRNKKVQVGIGTLQKSGTAHDIPTLERAFVLTPLASNKQLFEQLVGRLRRNSPGKTDAICYYFWDAACFPFHLTSIRRMYKENTYLWVDKEFLPQ